MQRIERMRLSGRNWSGVHRVEMVRVMPARPAREASLAKTG